MKCRIFAVSLTVLILGAMAFAASNEKVLYTFQGGNDCAPYGTLVADQSGNLFGTTYGSRQNPGAAFELTQNSGVWTETVLHTFTGANDGRNPEVGLVADAAGNYYGVTPIGGTGNDGVVYELSKGSGGWTETVLYTFTGGTDGAIPMSGLIIDQAGNLYGTTSQGGGTGNGVVFKVAKGSGGWTESVLYSFNGTDDGGWPMAPLIFDPYGNLYGTATQGGPAGVGVVFKLTPGNNGWTETVLHGFTGADDGGQPQGGLVRNSVGQLFSTTDGGGSDGAGTVFQLAPSAVAPPMLTNVWKEDVLYNFTDSTDGANPYTGLVLDQAGNLDGTTEGGGSGWGVIFQLIPSPSGWTQNVLYSFAGSADGGFPESTPVVDGSGNVYGTTIAGGQGCGVAYQLSSALKTPPPPQPQFQPQLMHLRAPQPAQ